MATESGVVLPTDATGKALRTETVTTSFVTGSGGVVHQQVVSLGDPTTAANLATVDANGRLQVSDVGYSVTTPAAVAWTSTNTGATYVVNTTLSGNVTFWVYNGGTAFSGTMPQLAFEQSADNVNWAPLQVQRSDTGLVVTSITMTALSANTALAFEAAMEGVAYARVRLVVAPSAGIVAVYALSGGGFFEPVVSAMPGTALVKGVQQTQGFAVQDLKDSGRTQFFASGTVTPTAGTEAMVTLTPYRNLAAGSAGVSLAVTAAKTLRVQSFGLTVRQAGTAAIGGMAARLRSLAGTVATTSPLIATAGATIATATANLAASESVTFPDGFEVSGSMQLGISVLGSAHPVDVFIAGFEY